jgi:hypothetical protein
MTRSEERVATLVMAKGTNRVYIVTNGAVARSYHDAHGGASGGMTGRLYKSLTAALAAYSARGWNIDIDDTVRAASRTNQ